MSESGDQQQWDALWQEYTKSLESWKALFDQMQAASADMQARFNDVWQKALSESSADTLKSFAENWQKAMGDAGLKPLAEFGEAWQKAMGDPSSAAFGKMAESWQRTMTMSGLEQMAAYGTAMKKFAETWNMMWPKS